MNPYIHKHWDFVAFNEFLKDGTAIMWGVGIEVRDAENEEDALELAKKVITRKYYHLRRVWECTQCPNSDRYARAMDKVAKLAE